MQSDPKIIAILLTFRRQSTLARTLADTLHQSRRVDRLYVVDNEASSQTKRIVEDAKKAFPRIPIEYLATEENLGSAGGWAHGMNVALSNASDFDWVLPLDDDNPPHCPDEFHQMYQFANASRDNDPQVAAVGIVGARIGRFSGLVRKLTDEEVDGAVDVDFVGTGNIPFYSVAALRRVGVFNPGLFFGYTEVEFGQRLRRAGYRILANGPLWRRRRSQPQNHDRSKKPSKTCNLHWTRYYVIRNHVFILKRACRFDLVLYQAAIQCVAKPMYTALSDRRTAWAGFVMAKRALFDGLMGKMGKRVEPVIAVDRESSTQISDPSADESHDGESSAGPSCYGVSADSTAQPTSV